MTPKAVAIVAALVLGGVLLGMNYPIADALWRGGPYGLSAVGTKAGAVWRMNQRTGQVSLCLFEGVYSDWKAETLTPLQTARMTPQCSPWGPTTER